LAFCALHSLSISLKMGAGGINVQLKPTDESTCKANTNCDRMIVQQKQLI